MLGEFSQKFGNIDKHLIKITFFNQNSNPPFLDNGV